MDHPRGSAADALRFLVSYGTYLIAGHKEPDGDCVGSQLALASFIERNGRRAVLLSDGPFTRTEIASFAGRFVARPPEGLEGTVAVVVMDCSSVSRTGSVAGVLPAGAPTMFMDHHAVGEATGDVLFVDTAAPAVTCLVQAVIELSGGPPTREEAEYLLFGLCTDTGFFRHLDDRSSGVFAQVSRLVAAGASPKKAFGMMNDGKPFASRKLMGELLTRAEARYGGKLLVTWMDLADQERFGLVGRDSDMLYQLLMSVEGMEVAVVVRQESADACTVGFRARSAVDVAAIAASFGGGGHRLAAGLHLAGQVHAVKDRMIAAFAPAFAPLAP